MTRDDAPDGFLSRWSRRKEQARSGEPVPPAAEVVAAPVKPAAPAANLPPAPAAVPVAGAPAVPAEVDAPPPPTLADVALLTRESDYSRFVGAGVDEGVKHAAMRKLFSDPHFNIMDGLDTYIDDYGRPDPIPLAMLREMNQSKLLRLFEADEAPDEAGETPPDPAAIAAELPDPPDDDADLRLQQDDAAGRPGPDQGPRP